MKNVEHRKVFISYSWTSDKYMEKIKEIADYLILHGVQVIMDIYDLEVGDDKYAFMEQIGNNPTIDKVLIFCDSGYKKKADARRGGVGNETVIITPEIYKSYNQNKFIPIVMEKDKNGEPYLPAYLKARIYIDCTDENNYFELVRCIYNKPKNEKPSIGKVPSFSTTKSNVLSKIDIGNHAEKTDYTWFAGRFKRLLDHINETRDPYEKEYTVEYISSLLGSEDSNELKRYLNGDEEPTDIYKKRMVDIFGVNEDWIVYNRGENMFASNMRFCGNDPRYIMCNEDLDGIEEFILVVGTVDNKRMACVIRKRSELCYEVYPKFFGLNSCVGGTGASCLVGLYEFLKEMEKRKKLNDIVYEAPNEEEMIALVKGEFTPKKVERYKVCKYFIEDFLSIEEEDIKRNEKYWDEDFCKVQRIISNIIRSRTNQM